MHEHDIFLADDRIVTKLPQVLGKTFYKGSKKPVPVSLEAYKPKDESGKRIKPVKNDDNNNTSNKNVVAQPAQVAREIERTLSTAQVYLSPSATTSVRVGLASFTPVQLAENIEAVVNGLVEKFVTKKWRNVRAVHIKGPNTMALPIWLADELWVDEGDVLDNEEAVKAIEGSKQKGRKRKGRADEGSEAGTKAITEAGEKGVEVEKKAKKLKTVEDADLGKEMALRREKLRAQKAEAREGVDVDVRVGMDGGDGTVSVVKKKTKTKKTKVVDVGDGNGDGEAGKVRVKSKKNKSVAVT